MDKIIIEFGKVIGQLYFDYIFAAVIFNWIVIKYILPNTTKEWLMALFSFLASLCIAVVFYLFGGYEIKWLFISTLTINAFYQILIKWILKLFNLEYKSTDPELIKSKGNREIVYPNSKSMKK